MKKVLILTYYWPPGSGPGVQRWLKFCKYLPENGWQPTVITVANGSYPNIDESLLNDIPAGMEVIRTNTFEPFALYNLLRGKRGKAVEVGMGNLKGNPSFLSRVANYVRANLFIPDARLGWNKYSYPKAIRWIKKNNPDAIITTGPPHSTHLVGQRLKSDFNIPWIADFRDPWTTIYYNSFLNRTEKSKQKDKGFEDAVLRSANAVITATPGLNFEFESRANVIEFIPNGFDEEDFGSSEPETPSRFKLSYVGNLKTVQNISALWAALNTLNTQPEFRGKFEFEITGNVTQQVLENIEKNKLNDVVSIKAFVPHKQAIHIMQSSNMLLLPIPEDTSNKTILTGKLFEYLATKRPILAIGPKDGNAAKILNGCGKSPMIDYSDQTEIAERLMDAIRQFQVDRQLTTDGNDSFQQYSRKGTAKQLAHFLNEQTT